MVVQDLLVLRLKLTGPRFFCWNEKMTPGIFLRCTYKIDVIYADEWPHLCADFFFQEGLDCKAEEEGSHGVALSDSIH